MIIPIGLLAWLAIWGIRKIPNKPVRIVCYVILGIIGLCVYGWMEDNGRSFCYKGHC